MDSAYFNDSSDAQMFPPKPKPEGRKGGMISISLNFIFYMLIYFFFFKSNVKFLVAILLVMFIHEFGHFVVMKRYGYSDKRLFFIPFMNMFLGQDDYQITLKQKLLILFFGPVPGIIMGMAALYFGHTKENSELVVLGCVFLSWNLINLFPLDSLDGGQLSESLFSKQNFMIQFVSTIVICVIITAFVVISRQVIFMIIPVFLGMRMQSLNKMRGLRKKLEAKGIDWKLNYQEMNNKQYWLMRKELLSMSSLPAPVDSGNEFTESIYESMIMQNIKSVLLNPPYNDLGKNGRIGILILWATLFIAPVT
ncbi:MAG: hypothetical protein IAF38_19785, partial [Bacteroidia bacterium]|nr:hypothetical protein [Bacteroidia bacterium]